MRPELQNLKSSALPLACSGAWGSALSLLGDVSGSCHAVHSRVQPRFQDTFPIKQCLLAKFEHFLQGRQQRHQEALINRNLSQSPLTHPPTIKVRPQRLPSFVENHLGFKCIKSENWVCGEAATQVRSFETASWRRASCSVYGCFGQSHVHSASCKSNLQGTKVERPTKQLRPKLCLRNGDNIFQFFRLHYLWPRPSMLCCACSQTASTLVTVRLVAETSNMLPQFGL